MWFFLRFATMMAVIHDWVGGGKIQFWTNWKDLIIIIIIGFMFVTKIYHHHRIVYTFIFYHCHYWHQGGPDLYHFHIEGGGGDGDLAWWSSIMSTLCLYCLVIFHYAMVAFIRWWWSCMIRWWWSCTPRGRCSTSSFLVSASVLSSLASTHCRKHRWLSWGLLQCKRFSSYFFSEY